MWPRPWTYSQIALKRQSTENNPREIDGFQYVIENHWDSVTIRDGRGPAVRVELLTVSGPVCSSAVPQFGGSAGQRSALRCAIPRCRSRPSAASVSIAWIEHLFKHQKVLKG